MYSHRDLRAHRDVARELGLVVGASVVLIALALIVPGAALGLATVAALVGLATGTLVVSERLAGRYVQDLRLVASGSPVARRLRAEVLTTPEVPGGPARAPSPSPHSRRSGRRELVSLDGPRSG